LNEQLEYYIQQNRTLLDTLIKPHKTTKDGEVNLFRTDLQVNLILFALNIYKFICQQIKDHAFIKKFFSENISD